MYEVSRKIMFSDCDIKAVLSVSKALEIVQDSVAAFYGEMKIDNVYLRNKFQAMWVFTKNKIKMTQNIHWNEEITIRSNILKTTKVKNYVVTEFLNNKGEVLVYSVLESCVLSINEGSIIKLDSIGLMPYKDESVYDTTFHSFEADGYSFICERPVTLDLIDYSHHVNNSEYIRLIISTLKSEEYLKANFNTFEVSYIGQAKENDTLKIYRSRQIGKTEYLIKNQKDEEVLKLHFILE